MTAKEINERIDYLFDQINWGASILDDKAIQIMNTLKSDIENIEDEPMMCTNCYEVECECDNIQRFIDKLTE